MIVFVWYESMRTSCHTVPILPVMRRPLSPSPSNELLCKNYPIPLRRSKGIRNWEEGEDTAILVSCFYCTIRILRKNMLYRSDYQTMRRPRSAFHSNAFSCKDRPIPSRRSRVIQNGMRIGILPFCFFFLALSHTTFETTQYHATCRSDPPDDALPAFTVQFLCIFM